MHCSINKLLKTIDDYIFSHIGKTKILFVVKNSFGWACQKPLYDAILKADKNNNFSLAICIESEEFSIEGEDIKGGLYKNTININSAAWKKWHYIIRTDTGSLYFRRNTVNVMMPHGIGFGNGEKNYNKTQYTSNSCDIYFGLSTNENQYIKAGLFTDTSTCNKLFIPVGSPKSDRLFNAHTSTTSTLLNEKKLDVNKKTIFIGSHWTDTALLKTKKINFIKSIVEKFHNSYNFIITGHDRLWASNDGKNLWADLLKLENAYTNILVTRYTNLYAFILASDIFITDHSSLTIECSTKNSPILFYDHPQRNFHCKDVLNMYRDACYSFYSTKDAIQHIENIASGLDSKQKERQKFVNAFCSNQGHAADFAASIILKLDKLPPSNPEKWKLIAKTKGIPFFS